MDETTRQQLMFDNCPYFCILFDAQFKPLDCSRNVVDVFGFSSKEVCLQNLLQAIKDTTPPYQSSGRVSHQLQYRLQTTVEQEDQAWISEMLIQGKLSPFIMLTKLVRTTDNDIVSIVLYAFNLDLVQATKDEQSVRSQLYHIIHENLAMIQAADGKLLDTIILEFLKTSSQIINVDKACIFENFLDREGRLACWKIHEWSSEAVESRKSTAFFYEETIPMLKTIAQNKICNCIIRDLPEAEQTVFKKEGILSLLLIPIFVKKHFWGYIAYQDCTKERFFSADEERILNFAALIIATAIIRKENRMQRDILRTIIYDNTELLQAAAGPAFENAVLEFLKQLGKTLRVNRVFIYQNEGVKNDLACRQLFEWTQNEKPEQSWRIAEGLSSETFAGWKFLLYQNKLINSSSVDFAPLDEILRKEHGVRSYLIIPIFIDGRFWGFMGFDDCEKEQRFTVDEENTLRSASNILSNAIISRMMKSKQERLNHIIHESAAKLQAAEKDDFDDVVFDFLANLGEAITVSRVCVYDNFRNEQGKLCYRQLYEWGLHIAAAPGDLDKYEGIDYDETPQLKAALTNDEIYSMLFRELSSAEQRQLAGRGLLTLLYVPIYVRGKFWGWIGIEDCENERQFSDEEKSTIHLAAIIMGSAILRNQVTINLIKEREEALALKQEHLDTVAQISKLIYWEWDAAKDILSISYHAKIEFGYEVNEITKIGNGLGWEVNSLIDLLHPEDRLHFLQELNRYLNKVNSEFRVEVRIRHKDGHYLWIVASGHITKWNREKPALLIGGFININDIKVAEKSNIAKSQFLATMSHEMRTPLNAILGFSEIELQNEQYSIDKQINLEKIYNSGSLLLGIINDILDVSKIDSGNLNLIEGEYSFPGFINDTIQLNMARIGSKPLEFCLELDETIPVRLKGDELRLKQILNNLLSNAVKYTQEGLVRLHVDFVNKGQTGIFTYIVSDTGQGIKKEDIGKLFSDYVQLNAKANRSIEGTGLGLSITKRLIDMMGGTITVESEYGRGSIFTVVLEHEIIEQQAIGKKTVEQLKKFEFSSKSNRRMGMPRLYMPSGRILLVDDVQTNLDVARGLLLSYGLSIDCVKSGPDAIAKIENADKDPGQTKYDLVFMDHMMPLMDGIETTKRIRNIKSDYVRKLPIIALTANAVAGNKEMFLQNGIDDFLAKPIDTKMLDAILKKWIAKEKQLPNPKSRPLNPLHAADKSVPRLDLDTAHDELPNIAGLDTKEGLSRSSLDIKAYKALLRVFTHDVAERIPKIKAALEESEFTNYGIYVHALKSAAYNCGAQKAGDLAAALEADYNAGHYKNLRERTEEYLEHLSVLNRDITDFLNSGAVNPQDTSGGLTIDQTYLHALQAALVSMNVELVNKLLQTLKDQINDTSVNQKTRDFVADLDQRIVLFDYDEALTLIRMNE
ncbi:ATP-binding protein [Breznakiellaceae bacterium SP9]